MEKLDSDDLHEAALDARIDALRKCDFTITLHYAQDHALQGEVTYELKRHAFPFGTAVNAKWLLTDPATDADALRYQQILQTYFNCAVAENAHKWYAMEKVPGEVKTGEAKRVWERCQALGLPMRGHCIFWGIDKYVQPWIKLLPSEELPTIMQARARHLLTLFDGKITEWDLNNEMLHGDYYAKDTRVKEWGDLFAWVKAIAPNNTYYVNDYDILQGNEIDNYVAHIRELLDAGADVGGIGDQAHFWEQVPGSEKLWGILDKLGQFGLPVKITEFDINTKDEARQAADTRRFYKLCFAHPAVAGILMWGFWEKSHWLPDAALWRRDWSLKPNGQAYVQLMEEWRTRGAAQMDTRGSVHFRGFPGNYRVINGEENWTVTLTKAQPRVIIQVQ